jgi:hypothetical protein
MQGYIFKSHKLLHSQSLLNLQDGSNEYYLFCKNNKSKSNYIYLILSIDSYPNTELVDNNYFLLGNVRGESAKQIYLTLKNTVLD